MTIEIHGNDRDEGLARVLTVWLCRVVGLALFAIGLVYWVRLIGLVDGPLWRFDLMPISWRIACPILAVLCPVAGIGLWMLASWGVVMWVLVAFVEGVMHLGLPLLFGFEPIRVGIHVFGLACLATLRLVAFLEQRRRRQQQAAPRTEVTDGKRNVETKAQTR